MTSTIYDIRVRYLLTDDASRGVRRLSREAKKAAKSTRWLDKQLKRVAAFGVGAFGLHQASKALIGFNSDLQQAKIQMGGMLAQASGGDFQDGFRQAEKLVADFQQIAKASVGTTKDFVDMASGLARPVRAAGLGMEQLKGMTKGAVIASRAFGIEAGAAARDIEAALMGQLSSRDRFARALLEPLGAVGEEGRKAFNELSAAQRAALLEKGLTSQVIQDMAKAQGESFSGVMSTFEDNLQMTLGKVGLPLFKALTAEIQSWNQWLDANKQVVDEWAEKIGTSIKDAFLFVKQVVQFFVENRGVLLTIAKALVAYKVGKRVGGAITSAGAVVGRGIRKTGGVAGMVGADRAMLGMGKLGAGVAAATSTIGSLVPAVGLGVVAFEGLYNAWTAEDRARKEREKRERARQARVVEEFTMPTVAGEEGKALRHREFTSGKLNKLQELSHKLYAKSDKERKDFYAADLLEITRLTTELNDLQPRMQAFYKTLSGGVKGLEGHAGRLAERLAQGEALSNDERNELSAALAKEHGLDEADAFTMQLQDLQHTLRMSKDPVEAFSNMLSGEFVPAALAAGRAILTPEVSREMSPAEKALLAQREKNKGSGKSKVNVTIQRIEVQSDDPDRFVFGMVSAFSDAAKNPSSALDSFAEG